MQSRYLDLFHNQGMYNFEDEIFIRGEDCNVQMPRTENNNNNIKIKEIFLETIPPPHVPHLP